MSNFLNLNLFLKFERRYCTIIVEFVIFKNLHRCSTFDGYIQGTPIIIDQQSNWSVETDYLRTTRNRGPELKNQKKKNLVYFYEIFYYWIVARWKKKKKQIFDKRSHINRRWCYFFCVFYWHGQNETLNVKYNYKFLHDYVYNITNSLQARRIQH